MAQLSLFLAVLGVGMRVEPSDLLYVLRNPRLLGCALLAINVIAPIVAIIVCRVFSIHPAVTVALVTLTLAPVGSTFSREMLPHVAPVNAAYAPTCRRSDRTVLTAAAHDYA